MSNRIIQGQTYTDKFGNTHDQFYSAVTVELMPFKKFAMVHYYIFANEAAKTNGVIDSDVICVNNKTWGAEYDTWFAEDVLKTTGKSATEQAYLYMAQYRPRILNRDGNIEYGQYILDPTKWESNESS